MEDPPEGSEGGIYNIYKIKYYHMSKMSGASIPLSAKFEGKPNFPHGINGVFVSMGATIGKNVTIFHQVTIGSNTLKDTKHPGSPTIGDNVYIGAGAKIIGGITIGDNSRIGANCVVVKDVKPNSTVVLGDNRVFEREELIDNTLLSYTRYKEQNE